MPPPAGDHYSLLGVDRCASLTEVKRAFKQRAFLLHPDRNPEGESLFKDVATAYQVLRDDASRERYNKALKKKNTAEYGASQAAPHPPRRQTRRPASAVPGTTARRRRGAEGFGIGSEEHETIAEILRRNADTAKRAGGSAKNVESTRASQQPQPQPLHTAAQCPGDLQHHIRVLWELHQKRWKTVCKAGPGASGKTSHGESTFSQSKADAHDAFVKVWNDSPPQACDTRTGFKGWRDGRASAPAEEEWGQHAPARGPNEKLQRSPAVAKASARHHQHAETSGRDLTVLPSDAAVCQRLTWTIHAHPPPPARPPYRPDWLSLPDRRRSHLHPPPHRFVPWVTRISQVLRPRFSSSSSMYAPPHTHTAASRTQVQQTRSLRLPQR